MNTMTHEKTIKGISIAVIVLSALAIIASLAGAVLMGIMGAALGSYTPAEMACYLLDDYDYYEYSYSDIQDAMLLMNMAFGVGVFGFVWELLGSGVGLAAGIFSLRNNDKPAKLKAVFGWTLAGAITALISARLITMTLLIIACVFAWKDDKYHKLVQAGGWQPAPGIPMGAAPVASAAPAAGMPTVPVPPAPAPAPQPMQATAPAAQPIPEAPVPPAQPVQPTVDQTATQEQASVVEPAQDTASVAEPAQAATPMPEPPQPATPAAEPAVSTIQPDDPFVEVGEPPAAPDPAEAEREAAAEAADPAAPEDGQAK